jgi:hypothetical protein
MLGRRSRAVNFLPAGARPAESPAFSLADGEKEMIAAEWRKVVCDSVPRSEMTRWRRVFRDASGVPASR